MKLKFSPRSLKTATLLFVQLLCIAVLAVTGKVSPNNSYLGVIMLLSLILAFWSMIILRFHLNAAPEVLKGTTLKTNGPYRFIRHPIYTSLLMLCGVWVINDFSYFRLFVMLVLFIDLILKLKTEEKFLIAEFPDYTEYMKKTKMLIPYLF